MVDNQDELEEKTEQETVNGFVGCNFCESIFFRYSEVVAHVVEHHQQKGQLTIKSRPFSQWFSESVYLIRLKDTNMCKIGVSQTPNKRLSQMNVPGLYIEMSYKVPHAYKIEKALHSYFFSKMVKGEWFDLSDDDIASLPELIRKLAQDSITRTKRSIGGLSNHRAKKKAEQFAIHMAPIVSEIEKSGVKSLQGIADGLNKIQIAKSSGVVTKWQAIEVSRLKSRISELIEIA